MALNVSSIPRAFSILEKYSIDSAHAGSLARAGESPEGTRLLHRAAMHALRDVSAGLSDLRRDFAGAVLAARTNRDDAGDRRRRFAGE